MNRQQRRVAGQQKRPVSDTAETLYARGNSLAQQGRWTDAAACYQRALALRPDVPQLHYNLGNALQALGRPDAASGCYRRALDLRPDYAEALFALGNVQAQAGSAEAAAQSYAGVLRRHPDSAQAHNNLGNQLRVLQRLEEAAACYARALALKPDFAAAHNNLGVVFEDQDSLEQAGECYDRAIAMAPTFADAHYNLGNVRRRQGRQDEAAACYRRALALKPNYPEAHTNLGNALHLQGRLEAALACYARALDLAPDFPEAYASRGTVLKEQGRLEEAKAAYRRAIALRPDFADAHNNLAMVLLARGEFAEGWVAQEWRWHTKEMRKSHRHFVQPQWRGEPAAGQNLLLHAEQGYGDTLQFCRYATLAAEAGLRVILQVPEPLVRLLRSLAGADLVLPLGAPLPDFDWHCPLLSMPLALRTTLETIPARSAYLRADPEAIASWRLRLDAEDASRLRVGLAWAGNPRRHAPELEAVDRRRSLPPALLAPILAVPGVQFVSLQKGGPQAPASFALTNLMDQMADFADTAALIANLDLVIAVDTAVAHLAAALGKPVWLLDRYDCCWRWLIGRRDSPWYPGLRIYRQGNPGDWDGVLGEVTRDLRILADAAA